MKILVSDMGGVLYSYDRLFDPHKHQENFDNAMRQLGLENSDIKIQLEGEWQAISKGLLTVYENKKAVKNLLLNLEKYQLVIVSTSLVKTSELILEKIGLQNRAVKIFDVSDYGSKKDKDAWKKIFEQLDSVNVIVEDSEKNLESADQAAKELNLQPNIYVEMVRM